MLNLLALDVANAAQTVLGIGGLIFFHELGHFLVGRMCGVKAEAFSIGFGPVIAKWQPGETEYRLSVIPLGGYVKFLGENPDERGETSPRSFFAATYPRKAAIMLAGVTMNVIVAFLLFVAAFSKGVEMVSPVIGSVQPGQPAAAAGLLPGDRILSIDGNRILDFGDVVQETILSEQVTLVVQRDGADLPPLTIRTTKSDDGTHRIGIAPPEDRSGLVIASPGTPADAAGVQPGDRVVAVGGSPVSGMDAAWKRHTETTAATARWTFERGDAGERVDADMPTAAWRLGVALVPDAPEGRGVLVTTDTGTSPAGAASVAGLPAKLRIVRIDETPTAVFDDVRKAVAVAGDAGRALEIVWIPEAGGDEVKTEVRPRSVRYAEPGDLGLVLPSARETVREPNFGRAALLGLERTHRWVMRIFATLRSLFTGGVSAKKLQGPVALSKATYQTADAGWPYLFLFLGMISMNLAVLNVLPVPLLDGGQLALITIEKIRGRPLPERVLEGVQWSGLILLLSFMAYIVVNDIRNL